MDRLHSPQKTEDQKERSENQSPTGQMLTPPAFSLSATPPDDSQDLTEGREAQSQITASPDDGLGERNPKSQLPPAFSLEAGNGSENMVPSFEPANFKVPMEFDMDQDGEKEQHHILLEEKGDELELMVHSDPVPFEAFLNQFGHILPNLTAIQTESKRISKLNKAGMTRPKGRTVKQALKALSKLINQALPNPAVFPSTPPIWTKHNISVQDNGKFIQQETCSAFNIEKLSNLRHSTMNGSRPKTIKKDSFYRYLLNSRFDYVQGHILNELLGGPGEFFNLVPISGKTNADMKTGVEKHLKTKVMSEGKSVKVEASITGWGNFKNASGTPFEQALPTTLTYNVSEWIYVNGNWTTAAPVPFIIQHKLPALKPQKADRGLVFSESEYLEPTPLTKSGTYRVTGIEELIPMDPTHLLLPSGGLEWISITGESQKEYKKVILPQKFSEAETLKKEAKTGLLQITWPDEMQMELDNSRTEFTLKLRDVDQENRNGIQAVGEHHQALLIEREKHLEMLQDKQRKTQEEVIPLCPPEWMLNTLNKLMEEMEILVHKLQEKIVEYGELYERLNTGETVIWQADSDQYIEENDREVLIERYVELRDDLKETKKEWSDLYYLSMDRRKWSTTQDPNLAGGPVGPPLDHIMDQRADENTGNLDRRHNDSNNNLPQPFFGAPPVAGGSANSHLATEPAFPPEPQPESMVHHQIKIASDSEDEFEFDLGDDTVNPADLVENMHVDSPREQKRSIPAPPQKEDAFQKKLTSYHAKFKEQSKYYSGRSKEEWDTLLAEQFQSAKTRLQLPRSQREGTSRDRIVRNFREKFKDLNIQAKGRKDRVFSTILPYRKQAKTILDQSLQVEVYQKINEFKEWGYGYLLDDDSAFDHMLMELGNKLFRLMQDHNSRSRAEDLIPNDNEDRIPDTLPRKRTMSIDSRAPRKSRRVQSESDVSRLRSDPEANLGHFQHDWLQNEQPPEDMEIDEQENNSRNKAAHQSRVNPMKRELDEF